MYKRKGAPNNQLSVIKTNYNSQNWRFDLYSNNKMERNSTTLYHLQNNCYVSELLSNVAFQ